MALQTYSQELTAQLNCQLTGIIVEIGSHNQIFVIRRKQQHGRQPILTFFSISQHLSTCNNFVAEVFHGIVFGSISSGSCLRIHPNQSILFPSPGTGTFIAQDGIPDGIFFATIPQIVIYQMESMLGSFPVERTRTTFTFGLHVFIVGFFSVGARYSTLKRMMPSGVQAQAG